MAGKKTYAKTPVITLGYVHLNRPDPKYNKYSAQATNPAEVMADFIAELDAFAEDNFTPKVLKDKAFRKGYKVNDDGTITINARSSYAVGVVDIKGRPISLDNVRVGGGTVARLNVELAASNGDKPGISLYLKGVQIVKLKEYSSGGFDDLSGDYADDEEAYVADDDAVAAGQAARAERQASFNKGAPKAGNAATTDDPADF